MIAHLIVFAAIFAPQEGGTDNPDVQELLDRLELLEYELKTLKDGGETSASPSMGTEGDSLDTAPLGRTRMTSGESTFGQTTRFSSTFNPAIGAAIDILGNTTTRDVTSGQGEDRIFLRAAELNFSAEIDPFGYGYVTLEAIAGEESEVEFIEGAGVFNRLPANFSIKGGKFLGDFGRFGQRHEHDLPFIEKPGVYYDYFGGSFNPVGVEVHQWFGLTDEIPVRWSVGMADDFSTHGHPILGEHGHDEDEHESSSKRKFDNFVYNARVTGFAELSEKSSFQLGVSANWAPELRGSAGHGHDEEEEEEHGEEEAFDTRSFLTGIDLTYKWEDPSTRRHVTIGAEVFSSFFQTPEEHEEEEEEEEEEHEEELGTEDQRSRGGYLWGEYAFNPEWTVGALLGHYDLREDEDISRGEYAAFVTYSISEFNRLRFQYRFHDIESGDPVDESGEDFHEFTLQWSLVLGSHNHGIDW